MSAKFRWVKCLRAPRRSSEDRAEVFATERGLAIVVADGAGGVSGGAAAAALVVERFAAVLSASPSSPIADADFWVAFLAGVDREIAKGRRGGETTAVVCFLSASGLAGASAGDSEAWIVGPRGPDDLTAAAQRKLRLGSGRAAPRGFARSPFDARLVMATDGLFAYAKPDDIVDRARTSPLADSAEDLVRLVTGRSGALADDVAVVVCEAAANEERAVL